MNIYVAMKLAAIIVAITSIYRAWMAYQARQAQRQLLDRLEHVIHLWLASQPKNHDDLVAHWEARR